MLIVDDVFKRVNVKNFKEAQIEDSKVEKILCAAMQAPSIGNQHDWEFILTKGKKKITELAEMSPYSGPIQRAPMAITIVANKNKLNYLDTWEQDLASATQNILAEAVELELGGMWIGVAPFEVRMKYLKNILQLPEHIVPFSIIALGYPKEEVKNIGAYDMAKVHFEKY
mgnify:FL=1